MQNRLYKRHEKACIIIIAIVLLDALMSYLSRSWTGLHIPTNAFLPFAITYLFFQRSGKMPIFPPMTWMLFLVMTTVSFYIGALMVNSIPVQRIFAISAAAVTFMVGYYGASNASTPNSWGRMFLFVGGMYTFICVVALLKVLPRVFPTESGVWLGNSGKPILRPSVMVNQNFQVLYVFFVSFPLVLCDSKKIKALAAIASVFAAYVLAQMQTRSGLMAYGGVLLMLLMSPLFIRGKIKKWLFFMPVVFIGLMAYLISSGLFSNFAVYERFFANDYRTLDGRIYSALYLFEKISQVSWWFPHGESEFRNATGNIPHFNPTAFFLRGGMPALIGWIVLFVVPSILLGLRILKKRANKIQFVFFAATCVSLIVQFSLNLAFNEQVWLWAGISVGALKQGSSKRSLRPKHA